MGGWDDTFVPLGINGAFTPLGVVIALTFVSLPFMVRTLQPVLLNLEREVEEVAATLGSEVPRVLSDYRSYTLAVVVKEFNPRYPAPIGEYGSIVFISGNVPYRTEIAPYLIVMRWKSTITRAQSFWRWCCWFFPSFWLGVINLLEQWSGRFQQQ